MISAVVIYGIAALLASFGDNHQNLMRLGTLLLGSCCCVVKQDAGIQTIIWPDSIQWLHSMYLAAAVSVAAADIPIIHLSPCSPFLGLQKQNAFAAALK